MYKACIALFLFFYAGSAAAQTQPVIIHEAMPGSAAGVPAAAVTEEKDGDDFFSEAEKEERGGDLNTALTLFGKAAFEYNNDRNYARYGSSLLRLSNVHYQLNHYTEAEQVILNVALKTYSRMGSRAGQMASYNQLGKIYLAAGKLTQSMWFYTQQGILARQSGNNNAYIDSILGLAMVKIRKKEYNLAAKDLNRAELLAKNAKTSQFRGQIRQVRATIPLKKAI